MNTWFTSDTHFYHANIIKYCNRPFGSVEEMNEAMIANWNRVVGKDDLVWHLGDFALGRKEHVRDVLAQLNGRINLVMGNHDHQKLSFFYEAGFNRVYDRPVVIHGNIILSHAPIPWIKEGVPCYNLFGHVHDAAAIKTVTKNAVCCCVERWAYTPIAWEQIVQALGISSECARPQGPCTRLEAKGCETGARGVGAVEILGRGLWGMLKVGLGGFLSDFAITPLSREGEI